MSSPTPFQGATPADRQSRIRGVPREDMVCRDWIEWSATVCLPLPVAGESATRCRPKTKPRAVLYLELKMGKEKFTRTKPHVNVGTIGHVDHGKTTL
ncbi:hypothetical protein, partial [Xylophilus ampelinus]|uniref:hypothetical protein n=1 Tax=Xylophilus ampelinus TaxID=54067 RepID=UPI00216AF415